MLNNQEGVYIEGGLWTKKLAIPIISKERTKKRTLSLNQLPVGDKAKVMGLSSQGEERRRMFDLGLVRGAVVEALQKSPCGDPIAYGIKGSVIALRCEDAEKILVEITF